MTPRIVQMTDSCGECPNYQYYSGGAHECVLVREIVRDKTKVAPFCPLAEFPSKQLAGMGVTIMGLQNRMNYSFAFNLLTFVAAKLKRTLCPSGSGVAIPLHDDKIVYLSVMHITEIEVSPLRIRFICDESQYVLDAEGRDGPELHEVVRREGIEEELFHRLDIAA